MSDQELHNKLRDYYGTAMMNGNPMAMMELEQAERASGDELRRMATAAGITETNVAAPGTEVISHEAEPKPAATVRASVVNVGIAGSAIALVDANTLNKDAEDFVFDEELTAKFRKLVQYFKDKVDRDEATFEREGGALERRASCTNITSAAQLADIMNESERITRQLYFDYETTMTAANEAAQQVYTPAIDPEAVGELADLMKHIINECSTLGANYNASINSTNLGNVVSTRYNPSASSMAAEARWRTRYRLHPVTMKREAEAEAQREEQRKIAAAEKAAADARYTLDFPRLHAEWEAACKEVQTQRDAEFSKRLKQKTDKAARRTLRDLPKKMTELQEKLDTYAASLKKAQDERAALSKFKIAEQLKLKQQEDTCRFMMEDTRAKLQMTQKELDSANSKLATSLENLAETVRREVNRDIPLPKEPRDPNATQPDFSKMSAAQQANYTYKEGILDYMDDGLGHSVSDVAEWCPEVQNLSLQRVGAIMRSMEQDGLLYTETVGRAIYYVKA